MVVSDPITPVTRVMAASPALATVGTPFSPYVTVIVPVAVSATLTELDPWVTVAVPLTTAMLLPVAERVLVISEPSA